MAFTYPKLTDIAPLPSSTTLAFSATSAMYVNPTATTSYVAEIEIHNTNNNTAQVVLCIVSNVGGSLGTASISNEMQRFTLQAYDTIWIEPKYPYVLSNLNDAIFGVAGLSGVNIQLRGGKDS